MWRLTLVLSDELKEKLLKYIAKRYAGESYYGKYSLVIRQAIEEFLNRREIKEAPWEGDEDAEG